MGYFKNILLLIALLAMFGCGGGKIPPTRYYALSLPPAPAPAAEPLPHTLVIMPLRTSSMLTQDRIVYRPAPEEVGYYEYHRWAQDPRESVTTSLIEKIRASGAFSSVARFDGRTRSDYVLRARIDRLEEVDFEGGVKVYSGLSAELLEGATMRVVWESSATSDAQVATSEMTEVVRQLSAATSRSLDQLTRSLAEKVRDAPPPAR
ncbi:MAG: ABC-type transport auxiliary lipoprotein family protein [Acidobacteria bacterium]|nr:ABC-type transport auxiliary lipoprotein family protein [Acidobacteriota bacterium]MDA1236915.1 ABC-type transport auxiliary lipoprotein family protein [Acidobacteriota bacterium]